MGRLVRSGECLWVLSWWAAVAVFLMSYDDIVRIFVGLGLSREDAGRAAFAVLLILFAVIVGGAVFTIANVGHVAYRRVRPRPAPDQFSGAPNLRWQGVKCVATTPGGYEVQVVCTNTTADAQVLPDSWVRSSDHRDHVRFEAFDDQGLIQAIPGRFTLRMPITPWGRGVRVVTWRIVYLDDHMQRGYVTECSATIEIRDRGAHVVGRSSLDMSGPAARHGLYLSELKAGRIHGLTRSKVAAPSIHSEFDEKESCYEDLIMPTGVGGAKRPGDLYRLRVSNITDTRVDGVRVRLYSVSPSISHALPYPLQKMADRSANGTESMNGVSLNPKAHDYFTVASRPKGSSEITLSFGDHPMNVPADRVYNLVMRAEGPDASREHAFRMWVDADTLHFEEFRPDAP